MSLTKAGIVQRITKETGLPKNKAFYAVGSLIEIVQDTLADGDDLLISGFGKFFVRAKSERRDRIPATGDEIALSAGRVVTFRRSGKLRDGCDGRCD